MLELGSSDLLALLGKPSPQCLNGTPVAGIND